MGIWKLSGLSKAWLSSEDYISIDLDATPKQIVYEGNLAEYPPIGLHRPCQAWVESLKSIEQEEPSGLIQLHPDVFRTQPRVDIIHNNVRWQMNYRYTVINY